MGRKRKKEKKGLFNHFLVSLVSAAVFIGCVTLIVITERDCAKKEAEIAEVNVKISEIRAKNDEVSIIIDSDDMSAYLEEVAFERGYAYPDERRFYDTTRD